MNRFLARMWRLGPAPVLVALLVLAAGCATYDPTRDERQSDLPWNAQQSWEGTISVPGLGP